MIKNHPYFILLERMNQYMESKHTPVNSINFSIDDFKRLNFDNFKYDENKRKTLLEMPFRKK